MAALFSLSLPMIGFLFALLVQLVQGDPALIPAVRGTVWLRAGDKAVGTGWIVDDKNRWVITARHVVADREKIDVFFVDRSEGRTILNRDHYLQNHAELRKRGRVATGTVIHKHEAADLALIQLDEMPADAIAMTLSTTPTKVGDPCYCIGHRHDSDLLWTRTNGHVRQTGKLADGYFWAGKKIAADLPILFLQLPIESGESGAAILNTRGEVIAVVSAISNRTPTLAFAIDISQVRKLLAEVRMYKSLTQVTSTVDRRFDVAALTHGTVWIRPRATDGRYAGAVIDRKRGLVLTTSSAVGSEDVIDIILPKWDRDRLVAEATAYSDLLGLRLSGHCVRGAVLARDPVRDLALVELDGPSDRLEAIPLAAASRMSERIASMSHPTGEELMWLYAAGTVRNIGRITLRRDGGDETNKPLASLLQLPHQGSASGGPVVNERGELVGVLASREGSRQELAYAATPDEIRSFLKQSETAWMPASAAAWLARGHFLSRLGFRRQAIEAFATSANLAPEDARVVAYYARALAEAGQKEATWVTIKRITSMKKRLTDSDAILSEAYLMLGYREGAMESATSALKTDPKSSLATLTLARLKTGKDALKTIEGVLLLDPDCAEAYRLRTTLYEATDPERRTKVLSDLTRAIELNPYDPNARVQRAKEYSAGKEFKKSVADWLRLTELEPLNPEYRRGLADAQFQAGDRPASAKSLASILRVNEKQLSGTLGAIRAYGNRLKDDNAADVQRVADWYELALNEVVKWSADSIRKSIQAALNRVEKETDVRRVELLIHAIESLIAIEK